MTFSSDQKKILHDALSTYGIDAQYDIAIEEMSELTKAIIKHRRYNTAETYDNLCEEIADVAIMIEQLFLSTQFDTVAEHAFKKINRLEARIIETKKGAAL